MIIPVVVGALFMMLTVAPLLSPLSIPGNEGDARFNLFVLEHIYQWIIGNAPSLRSPGIYFPHPHALFFSDTHAGVFWIYAGLRGLGFSDYAAFTGWFQLGFLLTYVAAVHALARMGLRPLAAAVGAAIFSFSLPMIEQFSHAQLVYRCGVPGAILYLWLGLRDRSLRDLIASANWLLLQMLISVYLGVFLFLLMLCFSVVWFVLDRRSILAAARGGHSFRWVGVMRFADLPRALLFLALVVAVAVLLGHHAQVSKAYGITREWQETAGMLPQVGSYFIMHHLPYWGSVSRAIGATVLTNHLHEHHLFMGFGALIFAALGLAAIGSERNLRARGALLPALVLGLGLLIVVTLKLGDFSLYKFIAIVPGFSAIRAVTRIILIMAFPIAVLAAFGVEFALQRRWVPLGLPVVAIGMAVIVFETASLQKQAIPYATLEKRIAPLIEEARAARGDRAAPVLAVTGAAEDFFVLIDIDAMMVAQRLGWPSVNGYSGFHPPGSLAPFCARPAEQIAATLERKDLRPNRVTADEMLSRVVFVGPADCGATTSLATIAVRVQAQPSQPISAASVTIDLKLARRQDERVSIVATIQNDGPDWLFQARPGPARLSWRFIPLDDAGASAPLGFDSRQDILADIPPRAALVNVITTRLPTAPGRYRLEASLVAEGVYWFHDRGMKIAILPDILLVQ